MPFSSKQNFKVAFLTLCAEAGLTIDETKQLVKLAVQHIKENPGMEKDAIWPWIGSQVGRLANTTMSVLPSLGSAAMVAGTAIPVAAGAGAGLLAARMTGSDNKSLVEDAKTDEIVGEYERLADEAKRRARLKQLQQSTGRRVIALSAGEA